MLAAVQAVPRPPSLTTAGAAPERPRRSPAPPRRRRRSRGPRRSPTPPPGWSSRSSRWDGDHVRERVQEVALHRAGAPPRARRGAPSPACGGGSAATRTDRRAPSGSPSPPRTRRCPPRRRSRAGGSTTFRPSREWSLGGMLFSAPE